MPAGRPSKYTPELCTEFCTRLSAESTASVESVCEADDMPCVASIMGWLKKYPEFLEEYERAREKRADLMARECLEIADSSTNDTSTVTSKSGEDYEVANHEWINRSRLRVDTRKWLLSKMSPKRYGDKIQAEISGDMTINVTLQRKQAPK